MGVWFSLGECVCEVEPLVKHALTPFDRGQPHATNPNQSTHTITQMICPPRAPKQRCTESFNNQTDTNELPVDDNNGATAVLAALLDFPGSNDPPGPRKSRRAKLDSDRMAAHKQELATANTKIKKNGQLLGPSISSGPGL